MEFIAMTKVQGGAPAATGIDPGAGMGGRKPNVHRCNAGGQIARLKRGVTAAAAAK